MFNATRMASLEQIFGKITEACSVIDGIVDVQETEMKREYDRIAFEINFKRYREKAKKITRIMENLKISFESLGTYATYELLKFYDDDLLTQKRESAEEVFDDNIYGTAQNLASEIRCEELYSRLSPES